MILRFNFSDRLRSWTRSTPTFHFRVGVAGVYHSCCQEVDHTINTHFVFRNLEENLWELCLNSFILKCIPVLFFKSQQYNNKNDKFTSETIFFLLKIKMEQEALRHSLYNILLNLPPHHQLLLIHPGPSWRSFSWRDLGVHHHMEISERSQCASGCPDEPQRRGYSPPACAHCWKNKHHIQWKCKELILTGPVPLTHCRLHWRGILDTTDNLNV